MVAPGLWASRPSKRTVGGAECTGSCPGQPLFFPEGALQGGRSAVPEAAHPSGGPVDGQKWERMQPGREVFALST